MNARTYNDVITDYLTFLYEKTNDGFYKPENFFKNKEENAAKAMVFKKLLENCYSNNGMFYFSKFILGDLMYAGFPKPLIYCQVMRKWEKLIKQHKHIAIESARGGGKSVFFSLILPLYRQYLFYGQKIMLTSASYPQSIANLSLIEDTINGNDLLSAKCQKGDKVSVGTGLLEYNGGSIVSRSVGSEIRGWHGDLIVHDDLLRSDEKISEEVIEQFVLEDSDPMILSRNGQIIVTGTMKHENDLFGKIESLSTDKLSGWHLFKFPAIINWEEKELQCPERFTWNQLMRKKASMTTMKFLKEYQLEYYSSKYGLFPSSIIKTALDKGIDKLFERRVEDGFSYVVGVDCARSGSTSADYTVVTVLKVNPNNFTRTLVYAWRSKGRKTSEQVKKIADISNIYDNPVVLVEKNNFGQDFIDMLVDDHGLMVESYTTGGKGQTKEELIRYLINTFENEKVVIPTGDYESKDYADILTNELAKFKSVVTKAGNETFKGVGSHDDCVDSMALANIAAKTITTPFAAVDRFTERDDESELEFMIRVGLIEGDTNLQNRANL
jgi:hypothetical protein